MSKVASDSTITESPATASLALLVAAASVLFAVLVFLYGAIGGPFVASLDQRLGEVLATEGRALRDAGDAESAMARLRQALDAGFRDPRQAALAAQDYARLAIEAGDFDAAVTALATARDADPADAWNLALLTEAYRKAGRNDDALETARAWRELGERTGSDGARRWALYNEGLIHRGAGDDAAAFEAFRASHEAVPNGQSAYQAAAAAARMGRVDDARALARWAIENGESADRRQAEALLRSIGAS